MASASNLRKSVPILRSSMGSVTNTLYRANVEVRAYTSSGQLLGSTKLNASDGSFDILNMSQDMNYFVFAIPKGSLPSAGTYTVSCDFASDFSMEISNVRYRWFKTISSATSATGFIPCTLLRYNNAGEFIDNGTVIDMSSNYSEIRVHVNISNTGQRNIGGSFRMNLSLNTVDQGAVAGTPYSTDDNTATMVNQNEQIIQGQQETHGLLQQIIQHISDQLYALWNQIYNLIFVPLNNQQMQDAEDTRDTIDDAADTIDNAISGQTSSINNKLEEHGNFVVNGIKALILPSEQDFNTYLTTVTEFFGDHFGALYYPFDLLLRMLRMISESEAHGTIYFPGIKFDNMPILENGVLVNHRIIIASEQTVRLLDNEIFVQLLPYIRLALNMVLTGLLVNQARKKYERVIRG